MLHVPSCCFATKSNKFFITVLVVVAVEHYMIFDKLLFNAITFHTLDILIFHVRMAQGLLADYFSRKSPSPSTVSSIELKNFFTVVSSLFFLFYFFIFFSFE